MNTEIQAVLDGKSEGCVACGDCLTVMADMPDGCVQMCVTSPPYWGLRDYGVSGQFGLEPTPEEYIAKMVAVFREVRRILRDDGTLWMNLGDSYNSDASNRKGERYGGWEARMKRNHKSRHSGLKPKDLCGIPWRVVLALQADGWYLRQDIIWHKPNPMPESVRDRCTKAHEYLFLLTKKPRYYYDADAIEEGGHGKIHKAGRNSMRGQGSNRTTEGGKANRDGRDMNVGNGQTRNRRSVWTIPTEAFPEAHFATYPKKLVEPCVLAGCPAQTCPKCGKGWVRVVERTALKRERPNDYVKRTGAAGTGNYCANSVAGVSIKTLGFKPSCDCGVNESIPGIVFDPFGGSGTTGYVAGQNRRRYILLELNPKYKAMAERRLSEVETGVPVRERQNGQAGLFDGD